MQEPRVVAHDQACLDIARHNAVEGCVHEAFAALVAALIARRGTAPVLRRIYARIAADEARHGQLAWDLHDWLMPRLSARQRALVHDEQREALATLPTRVEWLARLPIDHDVAPVEMPGGSAAAAKASGSWPSPWATAASAEGERPWAKSAVAPSS